MEVISLSYFISISFILVVLYLLFKNRQYTLPFDKIILKIFLYELIATIVVALISYYLEIPLSTFIPKNSLYYLFTENFFLVAPLEELSKFAAVYLGTSGLKNLRHKEDFIFYLIFSACIFSSIENLLYVFIYDQDLLLALLRNFVSTPCHLFYSIMLGYFYTMYLEHNTYKIGYFLTGLSFASLLHGFMNFCLCYYTYTHSLFGLLFASISLCFFYIVGFHLIKKHIEKALLNLLPIPLEEDHYL